MRSTTSAATRHALGARDRFDLAAAGDELAFVKGSAHRGPIGSLAAPVKPASGEEHELLPDRHAAVSDRVGLDVCAGKRLVDPLHPSVRRGSAPNASPKTIRRCVPVCTIRPGRFERGRDVRGPAERAVLARHRRDLAGAVDAVLHRQDDRVVAEHRPISSGSAVALS